MTDSTQGQRLSDIFNMPTGDMMEKLGLLTTDQVAASGRKQAYMVAVRNAIESSTISENDHRIPQFNGKPDLLALAELSDEYLSTLLISIGGSSFLPGAQALVNNREGVNPKGKNHTLSVPPMGVIQKKLGFISPDQSNASLIIQQAIRAGETALRLKNGQADPSLHAKKGEFKFKNDKDPVPVQQAVSAHEFLSKIESETEPGERVDITKDMVSLNESFDDAASAFYTAGHDDIAEKVAIVQNYYNEQLNLTQ